MSPSTRSAPAPLCVSVAKAASNSLSWLTLTIRMFCRAALAAACNSLAFTFARGLVGFIMKAITATLGSASRNSSSLLAANSLRNRVTPVALPSGRLRLATRPISTGSPPVRKTVGIVEVAAFAAYAAAFETAYRMVTLRLTSSVANAGRRSGWSPAQRYSISMFWPSTYPASARLRRKTAGYAVRESDEPPLRYPEPFTEAQADAIAYVIVELRKQWREERDEAIAPLKAEIAPETRWAFLIGYALAVRQCRAANTSSSLPAAARRAAAKARAFRWSRPDRRAPLRSARVRALCCGLCPASGADASIA